MLNESENEQDTGLHNDSTTESNNKIEFPLEDPKEVQEKELPAENSQLKLTGNLKNDIIHLMSLKPKQYQFSFTGLRRYLGIHQQQLVNTIDRLIEDSILYKTQDGYFLDPNLRKIDRNPLENWRGSDNWTGKKLYPAPISIQKIYVALYGKWFGKNRFLGGVNNKNENKIALEWIDMNNSNSQTRLEVTPFKVNVKFKQVPMFERDKALNVFSETFISLNNPVMFENSDPFINN